MLPRLALVVTLASLPSAASAGTAAEDPITATARAQFTAAVAPTEQAVNLSALYDCVLHPADPGKYQEDSGLLEIRKVGFLIQAESSIFADGSPSYQLQEGSEAIVRTGNGTTVAMRINQDGVVFFELSSSGQTTASGAKRDAAIVNYGALKRFATAYVVCQLTP